MRMRTGLSEESRLQFHRGGMCDHSCKWTLIQGVIIDRFQYVSLLILHGFRNSEHEPH